MSAVDGFPPRRRIDALTAASRDSCRSMALMSRCLTTPQSPDIPDAAFDRRRRHVAKPVLSPACRRDHRARVITYTFARRFNEAAYRKGPSEYAAKIDRRAVPPRSGDAVGLQPNGPPNSLFERAGYHVRDGKVYYLNAFPGKAFEIGGADAATFEALDSTYARDHSHVYINGALLPDADAASFELLRRPGFAKDRDHVYQRDRVFSDDPVHFELLDGELAKDSRVVFWSDGSVLSEDPAHFAIISDAAHYLYTRDGRAVHVNGNPIPDADPATFQVLQGAYARDNKRVFYFDQPIAGADLSSFRPLDGPYASDARTSSRPPSTAPTRAPSRPTGPPPTVPTRQSRSRSRRSAATPDTPAACGSEPCRRRPCRPG